MRDLIPEPVSTKLLARQGVTAVACIAGGALMLILGALPAPLGIIAGAAAGIVGIGGILSKDPSDRKPGFIAAAAGGLAILSRIGVVRPLAGTLLGIGAVGLLALGIWNGVKFLLGLKSRG